MPKKRRHLFQRMVSKRTLAEQIREMRDSRGWTQTELAEKTGKVQETISQLENPNYENYTLATLNRIAEAFDVALIVRFAPFSELDVWIAEMSPEDLAVPAFVDDGTAYGALFDGTTDDSVAIQAAIDACSAAGGGIVECPRGTAKCNVILKTGVFLVGAGAIGGFGYGPSTPNATKLIAYAWKDAVAG